MKILSVLLLTFMFILAGCGNTGSEENVYTDTSRYLSVAAPSNPNNLPVGIEQYVTLTFSEVIDGTTVYASSVYITDENNVPVSTALTVLEKKISIIPDEFFLPNKQYTISVTTAVEDVKGRTLENTFTFTFLTASIPDTLPPSLTSLTPADGTSADKATDIEMEFDENIAGNGILQLEESDTNTIVNGTTILSNNTLRFVPQNDLVQERNYTVTLQGTVKDLAGNAYSGLTSWNFSVTPENDVTPPSLISLTPADGTSADKATDIIMAFDEVISNGGAVLRLKNSDTNAVVSGTSTVSNNTMRFVPSSDLTPGANYTVTVLGPVTDLAGNVYTGQTSWDFSVNPLVDMTAPSLTSVTPADGTSADKATDIEMAFDESIAGNGVLQLEESDTNTIVNGTTILSNNTLRFVPQNDLVQDRNYTVTLQGTVKDLAGNAYSGLTSWNFSVTPENDQTAPSLISLTPADGTSADKATDVVMAFDETIAENGAVLEVRGGLFNTVVTGTTVISDNILRFNPTWILFPGTNYTVTVLGPVTDLAGNAYTGQTSWDFSVNPLVDMTAPSLISVTPADGTSANKATDIEMTFDEEITNGGAVLRLKNSDTNAVVRGTSTVSNNTMRFIPDSDLIPGANYTVTVLGPVTDLAGNLYTGLTDWSFSVDALLSRLTVVSIKNDQEKITIEFYEKLDTSTVSADNFLINEGANGFSEFKLTDADKKVEFKADSVLNGDEDIKVIGSIKDIYGNSLNGGVEANYSLMGIYAVLSVKNDEEKITIEFSKKLDTSTVSANDFLINGGAIGFSDFEFKDGNKKVEFEADTDLNGDEDITVMGTIKNICGVSYNNGVTAIYSLDSDDEDNDDD